MIGELTLSNVPDEYPGDPNDPYAGLTCNLEVTGMDLPKVAAALVAPMTNGYCSLRAEVIGDNKQFAELTFTDHQLNQFLDAYYRTMPQEDAQLAIQDLLRRQEQAGD